MNSFEIYIYNNYSQICQRRQTQEPLLLFRDAINPTVSTVKTSKDYGKERQVKLLLYPPMHHPNV